MWTSMSVGLMMMVSLMFFLTKRRVGVGGAEAFPLLFRFLENATIWQRAEPAQELPVHLSPPFVLPIEGTLLLALFAGLWRSILLLRVGAALTFGPNECSNDVTVLTWLRRSKLFDILCTFFTNSVGFALLLKLWPTVGAFHYRVSNSTLLAELLALRQLLEREPLVTLGTGIEGRCGHHQFNRHTITTTAKIYIKLTLGQSLTHTIRWDLSELP